MEIISTVCHHPKSRATWQRKHSAVKIHTCPDVAVEDPRPSAAS
jgi:hypothetical protein